MNCFTSQYLLIFVKFCHEVGAGVAIRFRPFCGQLKFVLELLDFNGKYFNLKLLLRCANL